MLYKNNMDKKRLAEIFNEYLKEKYPVVVCSLDYENPYQLLTATILSAQCTDKRVNIVTKELFKKYPTPFDLANANHEELCEDIKSTANMAKTLVEKHNGEVPQDMDDLLELSGVGRKTANVVRGNLWHLPGVVVDTHVKRISNRIGLTNQSDPVKIERELEKLIDGKEHSDWCHRVIYFGREICSARKPKCEICGVSHVCKYYSSL
jgi:endonuclease-3